MWENVGPTIGSSLVKCSSYNVEDECCTHEYPMHFPMLAQLIQLGWPFSSLTHECYWGPCMECSSYVFPQMEEILKYAETMQ